MWISLFLSQSSQVELAAALKCAIIGGDLNWPNWKTASYAIYTALTMGTFRNSNICNQRLFLFYIRKLTSWTRWRCLSVLVWSWKLALRFVLYGHKWQWKYPFNIMTSPAQGRLRSASKWSHIWVSESVLNVPQIMQLRTLSVDNSPVELIWGWGAKLAIWKRKEK